MSDTIITIPEEEPRKWQYVAQSDAGPRAENQDNYLLIQADGKCEYLKDEQVKTIHLKNWPENHTRLAVADGMGGHNNGRQASEAVIQALLQLDFQTDPQTLKDELINIHNKLFEQFHQGAKTPGSTLVMADIDSNGQALIANIGDSRAYLCHNGIWKQLTRDHTALEFAWRDGEIDEEEYIENLKNNTSRIVQAMGFGSSGIVADGNGLKARRHLRELRIELTGDLKQEKQRPDIFIHTIDVNDKLMLASDGVWSNRKCFKPKKIGEISLLDYVEESIEQATLSSTDNLTITICGHI